MELTPEETRLIEVMRDLKVEFGRISCVLFFQHGKLTRVEIEKVVESKVIEGVK